MVLVLYSIEIFFVYNQTFCVDLKTLKNEEFIKSLSILLNCKLKLDAKFSTLYLLKMKK